MHGSRNNMLWGPGLRDLINSLPAAHSLLELHFFLFNIVSQHCYSALRGSGAPLSRQVPLLNPAPVTLLAHGGSQSDILQHRILVPQHPGCVILGKWLHSPSPSSLVSGMERVTGLFRMKGDNECAVLRAMPGPLRVLSVTVSSACDDHRDVPSRRVRCPGFWTCLVS